ncbi:hypothetical protein GVN18_40790 [Pseudomonas sp. ODNR1LW]|nr:hypothetical protein [Pseudomonas sp. ODNR1LW]
MSQETRRDRRTRQAAADLCDEEVLLCAGAGVCQAALITIMASADAFAARLAASSQAAAELSTLQMRQLALSLTEMRPTRSPVVDVVGTHVRSETRQQTRDSAFYGAPVVT